MNALAAHEDAGAVDAQPAVVRERMQQVRLVPALQAMLRGDLRWGCGEGVRGRRHGRASWRLCFWC
jgi:hypothetical protein